MADCIFRTASPAWSFFGLSRVEGIWIRTAIRARSSLCYSILWRGVIAPRWRRSMTGPRPNFMESACACSAAMPRRRRRLQDVYVTVWRRAESFDPAKASAMTWMAVVARNKAIDRLRKRTLPTDTIDAAAEVADESPDGV